MRKLEKNIELVYITSISMIIMLKFTHVLSIGWSTILWISIIAILYIVGFIEYCIIKSIFYLYDKIIKKTGKQS